MEFDLCDIEDIKHSVKEKLGYYEEDKFGEDIRWIPDLISKDNDLLFSYIHASPEFDDFWKDRIHEACLKCSAKLLVISPEEFLYHEDTIATLYEIEAQVLPIKKEFNKWKVLEVIDILQFVYQNEIIIGNKFSTISQIALKRLNSISNPQKKGKALEIFLAFIFSQVHGFSIHSTNYRTETEEIDIVVKNHNTPGVAWYGQGSVILVEAKNHKEAIGSKELNNFYAKIKTRKGFCKFGFFITTSKFTEDFMIQQLRLMGDEGVIVPINGDHLRQLCCSENITKTIDNFSMEAILR